MLSAVVVTALLAATALSRNAIDVVILVVVGILGPHASHAAELCGNFLYLALSLMRWDSFENSSSNFFKL